MIDTLICTVGTSLKSNIEMMRGEEVEEEIKRQIRDFSEEKNVGQVVRLLRGIDPNNKYCGAEINTIEEAKKKGYFNNLNHLFFLVSDTEDGQFIGEILTGYYKDMEFVDNVEYRKIENLQGDRPTDFRRFGLRNLVKEIGEILNRYGIRSHKGEISNVAIDATGGYKAQIAIAVLIGQAIGIPVYYKHEFFNEIIEFPPMPVSFDYKLGVLYYDLFEGGDKGKLFTEEEMEYFPNEFREVFFDHIEENGERLYELSPIGSIYKMSFDVRYDKVLNCDELLQEFDDNERRDPSFRDDHYPKGFKDFVIKVWKNNKWIKTCVSKDYEEQPSIKNRVVIKEINGVNKLIGEYKSNFGARFEIILGENVSYNTLHCAQKRLSKKWDEYR